MNGQLIPTTFPEFVEFLNNPSAQAFLGALFFFYAVDRLIEVVRNISEYGEYPFDKRFGVTSNMLCATNGAIGLVLLTAILEAVTGGAELLWVSSGSEFARTVALAYSPFLFLTALLSLMLLSYVYWKLITRHQELEPKIPLTDKLRRVREALSKRGVSQIEVFLVPIISLILGPVTWLIPAFLETPS